MVNNVKENIFNLAINGFNKNKEIKLEIDIEEEKRINDLEFYKLVKFKYQIPNIKKCLCKMQNNSDTY